MPLAPHDIIADRNRLAALAESGLMDSEAEETFDRLTRLASKLLGVPVALVSLVDDERQFFKSQFGLTGWASEDRETPLTHSFCQHVVATRKPLIVVDAREHELVKDNLAIPDLGVIAYAGVPITSSEGEVLGSFCAIDGEPVEWTEEQLDILQDLADAVVSEVRLRIAVAREEEVRDRLTDVLDHSLNLIQSTDAEGFLTYVNAAWLKRLGYEEEEALGKPVWEIIAPESLEHCQTAFGRLMSGEAIERIEAVFLAKDGSTVPVVGQVSCRLDDDGQPISTRGFFEDRTERLETERALAEREVELARLVENASDLIVRTNTEGDIVYANPQAFRTLGVDSDGVGETRWSDFVHPDHRESVQSFYQQQAESGEERSNLQFPVISATGETIWLDVQAFYEFGSDGNVSSQFFARDITERREIDRLKNEFISVVSHELRTPLTSIRGALGLLVSGRLGTLPADGQRMLEVASVNTERLVRLINDILDLERLESGRTEIAPVDTDIVELVADAVEVMQPMAAEAGVTLRTEGPEKLIGRVDPDRMVQTLTNLISNAIKFSPPESSVVARVRRSGATLMLEVEDHGRGIPEDKIDTIFERFTQVDASDAREKGGTGLGLTICKSIVEGHGGLLELESEFGKGTLFRVVLPRAATQMDAPEQGPTPEPAGAKTILLCDDDDELREVLSVSLESRGYRVLTAGAGADALRLTKTIRPSLILLDLAMPGVDGWETLDRLKRDIATRDIPVIIHSGSERRKDVRSTRAVDWLVKPVAEGELVDAIERTLALGPESRVVVAEDDPSLARVLVQTFELRGLKVSVAASAQATIDLVEASIPDMLVLDVNLSEGDGFDVLRAVRSNPRLANMGIMLYTGSELTEEQRRAVAQQSGEVAIKTKVSVESLADRIDALLGRDGVS